MSEVDNILFVIYVMFVTSFLKLHFNYLCVSVSF